MNSFQEIVSIPSVSNYKGSEQTYKLVLDEVRKRYGDEEAEAYDPKSNYVLTFAQWLKLGYRVNKGEESIRSFTLIEKKDVSGNTTRRFKRNISLFHFKQVSKIGSGNNI
jgi:hypothetical protein